MSVLSSSVPDHQGRFGAFGGRYVPETLMFALRQLTEEYERARGAPASRTPALPPATPVGSTASPRILCAGLPR